MSNIKNIIISMIGVFPDFKLFFNLGFLNIFDVVKACLLMTLVTLYELYFVKT